MAEKLISKIPEGPLSEKWTKHKSQLRVVNPGNKRKLERATRGNSRSSSSEPDWEERLQLLLSENSVIMSRCSA